MDAPLLEEGAGGTAGSSPLPLPKPLEDLFLTMHYRRMQRELHGPQKKKTRYQFVALAVLLVIVYNVGLMGAKDSDNDGEVDILIKLTLSQMVLIGVWMFVAFAVTAIFAGTKFVILLYWMVIYWPLVAFVAAFVFSFQRWVLWTLLAVEIGTVLVFLFTYFVYPRLVTSRRFLGRYGATRFWGIKLMDDGKTMEYYGPWGRLRRRHRCRYVGETNEEGLPHGQGVWSDDIYIGEILTGRWEHGQPVAPFSSRQYGGKGNTFAAVRLAYFKANDDPFESNNLVPTNDEPPVCGIASVECSVAGHFMTHLPDASLLGEARVEGEDGTIGACCSDIDRCANTNSEDPITSLRISTDSRGVQIGGHNYVPTGMPFTKRAKEIIIGVACDDHGKEDVEQGGRRESITRSHSMGLHNFRLDVRNWARIESRDALIFLPGFNSWLKHSLETFGQLMAMTPKMNKRVYPILFAWPGGQVITYRQASFISASENNKKYFLQMLESLRAEGITNIHIVSHSLGVQTLLSCFEDKPDGSPSDVAQCFGSAPKDGYVSSPSVLDLGKFVCRSITMLNPDFPANAFREHGFRSIRRVCSLITVVGDVGDQALFWSSLINGFLNKFGQSQPSSLDYADRCKQEGLFQATLGKNIDQLYVEKGEDQDGEIASFRSQSPPPSPAAKEDAKIWLDCDVIDTTGLDTNVNDLRHSAFNVNSILLRDIEELVLTGKRASSRTTLLHKRGNVYEFCHAPSFIKY